MSQPSNKPRIIMLDLLASEYPELRPALQAAGLEVAAAFSSEDVLHRVHRERVDLILLGTGSPIADPAEVARELTRKLKPSQFLPLLVVAEPEQCEAFLQQPGIADVVRRPLTTTETVNRVQSYLRLGRQHDRLAEDAATLARCAKQATEAHRMLLPGRIAAPAGWTIAFHATESAPPAGDIAGAVPIAGGRLGLYMVDVRNSCCSRATVLGACLRGAITASLAGGCSPAECLRRAIVSVSGLFEFGDIAYAYVAVLDPAAGTMLHASAGLPRPILQIPSIGFAEEVDVDGGPILGADADATYDESTTDIPPGARLFLLTNGILRQRDDAGDVYGIERLIDMLAVTTDLEPDDALDFLGGNVSDFRGSRAWDDDILLMLVARDGDSAS